MALPEVCTWGAGEGQEFVVTVPFPPQKKKRKKNRKPEEEQKDKNGKCGWARFTVPAFVLTLLCLQETEEGEEVRPWALATSKAYHCAVLLLAVVVCTDAILGLSSWQHVDLDVEVSWRSRTYTLFTDAAAGRGSPSLPG